jgi:hypothetical protein
MTSASQISHQSKIRVLPLIGGILALSAEATVLAVLMMMAGICTLGSIIWWLIEKGGANTARLFRCSCCIAAGSRGERRSNAS